ncbi:glycosyltransferase family 9 protein [Paraburkholderia lycopersici]|uniref:Heptosyltransferase-2 n=1 Tax=Paraburkholderia lycopersici TaxID=416944 RepID=A0A1G6RZD5_9BURK|nr:glycosyltransferase family 9 protein [Paraburkholderia lycopersici]SDD09928.1 heptosyltransferase-2 [Paraburkholderia lycopersici]
MFQQTHSNTSTFSPAGWLDNAVSRSTVIPYQGVPYEPEVFLRSTSRLKIAKKYLHKQLLLKAHRQLRLERGHLGHSQRILWIYAKRNFGDATMDMAGRALLKDKGVRIDLLALPSLVPLFNEDDVFGTVYGDPGEVDASRYDAILLSEYNLPSIRLKTRHFAKLPYACLFRYFNGPDRNQTRFSFASINDVFSLGHSADTLSAISKPYLASRATTRESVRALLPARPFIALAAGGVDPDRTYHRWPEFVELLSRYDNAPAAKEIVVLGSDNGEQIAQQLCASAPANVRIRSLTGKLAFLQAREIVAHAALFVGADGGLMHVAHTTRTPSVSLFSHREPPHLRLTEACHSIGLQGSGNVDTIAPAQIVGAVLRHLSIHEPAATPTAA